MAVPATVFLAACEGDHLYVRAVGLANMRHAPTLDAFIEVQRQAGVTTVCIDLSECVGMDSTFMGLLVGTCMSMSQAGGRLVVVNPGESNRRLLDMLGVSQVVPVLVACPMPSVQLVALESVAAAGTVQRMELIRRAHVTLSSLSEGNRAQFAGFIAAMDADLARLKGAEGAHRAE